MKGRMRNLTPWECTFRIFLSASLVIISLSIATAELTLVTALAALALAAISLYLFVTALTGFCPVYAALGVPPIPR